MKVRDIMTKNVAYINPMANVIEAAQIMQKHNVGSVPVCDENGVQGIVTDRDIIVRNIAHGKNPAETQVKDVMTTNVSTVTPDTDVEDAAKIMAQQQVRRLPVVDNNMVVGMISLGDFAVNSRTDVEASEALSEISKPSQPVNM
ncbi:MAG TPA: CBS domain-containing protein [Clostridiaceae bacterium]|jgi:CBS domain-containing protein|nr:CBS domain-containing protein [Clostridiaceae bacterium]